MYTDDWVQRDVLQVVVEWSLVPQVLPPPPGAARAVPASRMVVKSVVNILYDSIA